MPKDATQPGVSIPDLNDPASTFSRADAMNAMRARRRETAAADMTDDEAAQYKAGQQTIEAAPGTDEDSDEGDRIAAAARAELEAQAARENAQQPAQQQDDTQQQLDTQTRGPRVLADDELGNTRVKVKVNGIEREVSVADLRNTAQKVEAADVYLEIARQRVAEATQASAAAPASPALPSTDSPQRPTGVKERVGKAFASTFAGDEAAATDELTAAIEEATRNSASPEVIRTEVARALREDAIANARKSVERNHKEYVDDPIKRSAVNHYIADELQGRGVNRLEDLPTEAIGEVFDNGVKRARAYFGQAPSAAPQLTVAGSRRDAKKTIDEPATAGTRSVSTEPPPRTASGVINDMKKARGQQVPA